MLSGHLLGSSCSFGWPYVPIVFCLFGISFISHFGFKSGIWLLIAPVPVHCFSITLVIKRINQSRNCPGITTTMKNKKFCCKSFVEISAVAQQ